jgi:hypothetical protein
VRVPENAAIGAAKAKLSFPAWSDGEVTPVTFDIQVVK